ncbi:MAG: hypothetical protein JRH20_18220, partial [Deltaproteobacteria bacterium]|nr:hypothetical protein [Deltaproteobacteria bacterium]
FDQMLGLCLVPADSEGGEFTVSRAAATVALLPSAASAERASGELPSTTLPLSRKSRLLAISTGVIALVAVALGLSVLLRPAVGPPPPSDVLIVAPNLPPVTDLSALDQRQADQGPADQGPSDQREGDSVASPKDATRRRTPRRPRRKARGHVKSPPPKKGEGWLRVGGSALLRAKVEIDGKSFGRAPAALKLPLGKHMIVVRAPDDNRILFQEMVTVEEGHRRSTPLRLIVR